ncbi:MAG: class I SAM-dependent methyltransferase [Myxococcota bacterium]
MHPTTRAVRALYERYPYPEGPITLRIGFDVRRTLASIDAERPTGRPIHVLDAGCGRGAGVLGMALAQPEVHFLGIDLNRTALSEARANAKARGLTNVRFAEVDLETLEGLQAPEDGFDVIVSSGVLHHLVDPHTSLDQLASHLAPWGVIDLMVYAQAGRVGIERVATQLADVKPHAPIEERLAAARAWVAADPFDPDYVEASRLGDVEFVDRYLHPQFVSYTVDELHTLVESKRLRAIRWTDRAAWGLGADAPSDLWAHARGVESQVQPRMFDLLLSHRNNAPRAWPTLEACDSAGWALNGEGQLQRGIRTLWAGGRDTPIQWSHPSRPDLPLAQGPAASAAQFLTRIHRPFRGSELLEHLVSDGFRPHLGRQLLRTLAALDVLWCPHEVDLRTHEAVPLAA